jgi:hypothetical protein
VASFEDHLAAQIGTDERGTVERNVSQVVITVVVCIHHMGDRLVGDFADVRGHVSTHFVRTTGIDKDHSLVTDDDGRIDHVTMVEAIRVLDGTQKDVHAFVDL